MPTTDVATPTARFAACVRCLIAGDALHRHVIEPIHTADADATAAAAVCAL